MELTGERTTFELNRCSRLTARGKRWIRGRAAAKEAQGQEQQQKRHKDKSSSNRNKGGNSSKRGTRVRAAAKVRRIVT